MIIVKDGHSQLNGTRGELLEETALLFDSLLDVAPEVLIICLKSYEAELIHTVKNSNPATLRIGEEIVSKVREHIKEDKV